MELDEHINYFFDKDNRLKLNLTRKINKKYPNIKEYLLNKYEYVENLSEAIIRIKYNIDKRPICPICGGKLKYVGSKGYLGNYTQFYIPHCSIKCSKKDKETIRKYKETCLEKYGVENPSQAKEVKDKKKETTLLHYGVENPLQSEEIKKKISNTVMKRYGVKWITSSIDFINKSRDTMYKKYGCIQPMHNEEIVNRMLETKRRNNSFHTSKPEEELYLYIKDKFPLVERQYNKDIRYPFDCDFYIPELDYFIELNGFCSHGGHPYNPKNKNDVNKLNSWKEKSVEHPMYNNMIKTWTVTDPLKRKIAKQNNLHFKEVWTLDEGKKFIDELGQ